MGFFSFCTCSVLFIDNLLCTFDDLRCFADDRLFTAGGFSVTFMRYDTETEGTMATIELKAVCKQYRESAGDGHRDFRMENLNLVIPDGKTVALVGPNGCGKTTVLKIIAGLDAPDSGAVLFDGVDMTDVKPNRRGIGMVFQNYALYPHLTSRSNILSYFLFRGRTPKTDYVTAQKYRQTADVLDIDMDMLLDKKPSHLSGGEQQRVALGRCITRDPKVFLLDEPFSNLDRHQRESYRIHLRKLLRRYEVTTVYVTHEQREALLLADLIAVMNNGRLEQFGLPDVLYNYPKSMFVADFLSWDPDIKPINFVDGNSVSAQYTGKTIGFRTDEVEKAVRPGDGCVSCEVHDVRPDPVNAQHIISCGLNGADIVVRLPLAEKISHPLVLRLTRFHVFDSVSGERLQTIPE
jgi:ABC-type sugar transport system ATPase subunit